MEAAEPEAGKAAVRCGQGEPAKREEWVTSVLGIAIFPALAAARRSVTVPTKNSLWNVEWVRLRWISKKKHKSNDKRPYSRKRKKE